LVFIAPYVYFFAFSKLLPVDKLLPLCCGFLRQFAIIQNKKYVKIKLK
jgi:hypothetical protein